MMGGNVICNLQEINVADRGIAQVMCGPEAGIQPAAGGTLQEALPEQGLESLHPGVLLTPH